MVAALEKAFEQARKLPDAQQEKLAAIVLDEIASEKRWAEQFGGSQDALLKLADAARAEFDAGKTKAVKSSRDLSHD
jgi:hypothetical protein